MRIASFDTTMAPLLVAEIGNNHEGSFSVACELVDKAAACGVHAVKFQVFRSDFYVSRSDAARHARLKSFELTLDQFCRLGELAKSRGLAYIITPFDLDVARELAPVVDAFKIASGDNDFWPLIDTVCRLEKPLIISTGLLGMAEVEKLVAFVLTQRNGAASDLAVLHCACAYPVPPDQANLGAIPAMRRTLPCEVGYSDHTMGPDATIAAVALGASIVEKHFTLSKTYSDFRDHQLSADPAEMRKIAESMRRVAAMLGTEAKQAAACEQANLPLVRRTIVAAADLPVGHRLHREDLTWIRAPRGLAPGEEDRLVGRELRRAVAFGDVLDVIDLV